MKIKNTILPVILSSLVCLNGCFLLRSNENRIRYYVVSGEAAPPSETGAIDTSGISMGIRQIRMAAYLESPNIIIREGPSEVSFSEYDRWGEDLDEGINRSLASYLKNRPIIERVDVVPLPAGVLYDYLLQVEILRFEGQTDRSGVQNEVANQQPNDRRIRIGAARLLANWEIIRLPDIQVVARGTTDYVGDGWRVGDYEQLVALLNTGLRTLADEVTENVDGLPVQQGVTTR